MKWIHLWNTDLNLSKRQKKKFKQRSNERYWAFNTDDFSAFDSPVRFSINSRPEQPIDYLRESNPFSDLSQK